MTDSNLTIYKELLQGSDEWLEARRGLVTASTVKALLTPTLKVANNDTSRGLTATLVAERITGQVEPSFMNADMERGVLCEPVARDRYAEVNGVEVQEVGFMVRTLPGGAKLGASPDGLVGVDGGLEVKSPRAKGHINTVVADKVPSFYMPQIQACLLVSGREWWDFVSFHAGLPLYIKRVYADPEWHAAITAAVLAFEEAATALTSEYLTRCEGLPTTDAIDYLELVI